MTKCVQDLILNILIVLVSVNMNIKKKDMCVCIFESLNTHI